MLTKSSWRNTLVCCVKTLSIMLLFLFICFCGLNVQMVSENLKETCGEWNSHTISPGCAIKSTRDQSITNFERGIDSKLGPLGWLLNQDKQKYKVPTQLGLSQCPTPNNLKSKQTLTHSEEATH